MYGFIFCAEALGRSDQKSKAIRGLQAWLLFNSYNERLGNSPPHVLSALREEALDTAAQFQWPPRKKSRRRTQRYTKIKMRGKFNFAWARSRLGALALAAGTELQPGKTKIEGSALLGKFKSEGVPQLLHQSSRDLPKSLRQALVKFNKEQSVSGFLGRGVENRVVIEPEFLPTLRKILVGTQDDPGGVLQSHLISEVDAEKLRGPQPDLAGFFQARAEVVVDLQRKQLERFEIPTSLLSLVDP